MIRKKVAQSALYIMLSSLSDSSIKQYDSYLRKWFTHCKNSEVSLFSPAIRDIIIFMSQLYGQGAQYGTLNSCKSALSLLLGDILVNNQQIKRLMKGMFRLRPTRPKYNVTWNTSLVLNHLAQWYPNDNLALHKISKKLSILLALITANRAQTLSKIKVSNIRMYTTKIIIHIPDLIKTDLRYALQGPCNRISTQQNQFDKILIYFFLLRKSPINQLVLKP